MYGISDYYQGIKNPKLIAQEFNRLYYTRFRQRPINESGVDVMEEDWDNLLILDACRADVFCENINTPKDTELDVKLSKASSTAGFLKGNFTDRDLSDTVYVTGNTMLYRETELNDRLTVEFHDVINVWQDSIDFGEFGIQPETMKEFALNALDRYPNKRLIIHFIQPHIPFIGEFGRQLNCDGDIWREKRRSRSDISDSDLWKAYIENLNIVLPVALDLMRKLRGRTVITSDHGQAIGNRSFPIPIKEYGHPAGIFTNDLIKVPWLSQKEADRRRIVPENPTHKHQEDMENMDRKAKEHLKSLGYR